jgi:hypothetical protein
MKKYSRPMLKSIIANAINIVLIIIIIVLVRKIPAKAQSVKELSNQKELAQEKIDLEVLSADLLNNRQKIEQIDSLFADPKEILQVIEALSNLKNSGQIEEFNLADNPIRDKSGQTGLPIRIKGTGSRESVDATIRALHAIGKIVKPEKLTISLDENISFEYTAFLLMR